LPNPRNHVVSDSWHLSFNFAKSAEPSVDDSKEEFASTASFSSSAMTRYRVESILKPETFHYLLNIHYAKRVPPISFAFGLFFDDDLVGVCTYGMPASPSLCKGIAGNLWKDKVLELNRIALRYNRKNEASILVGRSLKLLPKPSFIVSYADTDQNHIGIIYQATNWIYTGASKERIEVAIEGLEHLHSKAITNMGTWAELKQIYGNRVIHRKRSAKHRYIFIVADRRDKKMMQAALKYKQESYPKEN